MTEKQKILIVDDRRENVVALRQVLSSLDVDVIEADNGNDALAATIDHSFALAILDVRMPGMDGYELAEFLRGDDRTKIVPIIFVTASHADERDVFQGYEAGGIDYIVKPYEPRVLLGKARVFLELARYREELRRHRDHLETLVEERTRATQCLYTVSSLVAEPRVSMAETLTAVVQQIPRGFRYPRTACARIILGDQEFATPDFRDTDRRICAEFVAEGDAGAVEACYLEEGGDGAHAAVFVDEEQALLSEIARQLGVLLRRTHAEQALRRSEQCFRQIWENVEAGIMLVAADTREVLDVNPVAAALVGAPPAEIVGKPCHAHVCPAQKDSCPILDRGQTVDRAERQLLRVDGSSVPIIKSVTRLQLRGRDVLLESFVDVSRLKQAQGAALRERDRAEKYLDVAGVMMLAVDCEGIVTMVNRKGCEILGFPAEDVVGKSWLVDFVTPATREAVLPITEALLRGDLADDGYHESTVLTRSGEERLIAWHQVRLQDEHGHVTGYLSSGEDVTAKRNLEAQLRQSQKLESIGTLASGVAHEINNPINGIMNYAQLIKDDMAEDREAVTEFAGEIIHETKRIATLVSNLLRFARHDKEGHSPARVRDIVEETSSLVRTVMRHDQISLDVDIPEGLPTIRCRSQQIQQVLMNLLTNARDALNDKYQGYDENKIIRLTAALTGSSPAVEAESAAAGLSAAEPVPDGVGDAGWIRP